MGFLPLTNRGRSLRPEYRWPITGLTVGCTLSSFVPSGLFAWWLARVLHLHFQARPAPIQENEGLWFFLVFTFFFVSLILGYLGSFVVLAGILRWFHGWSTERLRALIFDEDIPRHWQDSYRGP